ncbi:glycosyltransferase [Hydrogenimonas sp.]|nr:glycosyltransferase [Hydrogenimonas sp.]
MKVFTFFVEPSSYTRDLISNIHEKMSIDYIFLNNSSHAIADGGKEIEALTEKSLPRQIRFLLNVHKNYDLIIFNGYDKWQFMLLFILNLLSRNRKVLAIDSDTRFRKRSGIKGLIKKLYLTPIFSNRNVLGFPGGNFTHKELFRRYGMKEDNIFLMPMMVNNKKFFFNGTHKNKPFTFLFVGRIIPLKQIDLLIESFLSNFANNENAVLKIVGGGKLLTGLKKKYDNHSNIIFTGPKFGKDLVNEYHSSNVLVLPSEREQWGLVVNEALAAGLPVIASEEVGAIFDLIDKRDTGYIFSFEPKDDLANKMKLIYDDKNLYEKMSKNASKLMQEYWNYDLYKASLSKAIGRCKQILERKD